MNNKIALISVWIGKVDGFKKIFWKSASYNRNVDFYCFADYNVEMSSATSLVGGA